MTEVRRITAETARLLERVAEDVFDEEIVPERLIHYLADTRHALFVATEDDVVIGQARGMIHLQPDKPPELYIDNLGVAPAHQRRGLARALVQALMNWARSEGCASAWVATETDNVQANPFYAALGFTRATVAYYETALTD